MYIVKYIKSKYFDDAVDNGNIRIGTFGYFRKIKEDTLRDENEGPGKIKIYGNDMSSDVLQRVVSKKFPNDFVIKFKAGEGHLIDDLEIDCLVYCTSYVNNINEIPMLKNNSFKDKDKHFFIADEHLFETRCGNEIKRKFKINRPREPVYVYCFTGKVSYIDSPKETNMIYKDVEEGKPLRVNLRFLFEKPASCINENEYRFVWFCTNKPLHDEYGIYSISDDYIDVPIDPTDCITEEPSIYKPSKKSISVWDLNK